MQDTRHPIRKALLSADSERRISAAPPIKDPEMQAWLSPLSVREGDRTPVPAPAAPSRNLLQGFTMSAVVALAVGTLTWTMLPRSDDSAMLLVDGASLEASMAPAAGGSAADLNMTPITDEAGIEEIERLLLQVAFQPGTIDGMLDDRTEIAIREFEQAAGHAPTGLATMALRDELRAVAADLASQ